MSWTIPTDGRRALWRRGGVACAVLMGLLGVGARAEDVPQDAPRGVWVGHYACAQGTTGLTLTIDATGAPDLEALFHFYPDPSNRSVPEGCFEMDGRYDVQTRHFDLQAGAWLLRPPRYVTVDLSGELSTDGATARGVVIGPGCGTFELHLVREDGAAGLESCRPQVAVAGSVGRVGE